MVKKTFARASMSPGILTQLTSWRKNQIEYGCQLIIIEGSHRKNVKLRRIFRNKFRKKTSWFCRKFVEIFGTIFGKWPILWKFSSVGTFCQKVIGFALMSDMTNVFNYAITASETLTTCKCCLCKPAVLQENLHNSFALQYIICACVCLTRGSF